MMDKECGAALKEIEDAGLTDDTIVIYWGDHGSGMPRNKRWPYNSGLHVPMMMHVPENGNISPRKNTPLAAPAIGWSALSTSHQPMLSLVGIEPKKWMQGRAFAGPHQTEPQKFSYGFRGRMDERYDLVRTVMGKRYIYLRQYMPHRIYGQYIDYMFVTPTTRVWHDKYYAGELNAAQSHFWEPKPSEELYDLQTDPDEVTNLAGSDDAEHQKVLTEMRAAHQAWERDIRDVGFLPEAEVHSRSVDSSPYEMGHDPKQYDFDSVFAAADLATMQRSEDLPKIVDLLESSDSAVRYWGATGLLIHGQAGVEAGGEKLVAALDDSSASVAIVAAETLGRFSDNEALRLRSLDKILAHSNVATGNVFEAILATNALDYLDEVALPKLDEIKALPSKPERPAPRVENYVKNILPKIISDLEKK